MNGLLAAEVVIEAVLDRRADGHLRAGEQPLHDRRDDVRGVVADELEALGVLRREDRELAVVIERPGEVDLVAVELREQRGLGEARADLRAHEVGDRRAGRGLLLAPSGRVIVTCPGSLMRPRKIPEHTDLAPSTRRNEAPKRMEDPETKTTSWGEPAGLS